MFRNFSVWYRTDPQAKRKIFLWIIIFIILIIIGAIIFLLTRPNPNINEPQVFPESVQKVTQKSFEEAPGIIKVDDEPLLLPQRLFFVSGSDQPVYFDRSLKLKIGNQTMPESPKFIAKNVNFYDRGLIINQDNKSTLYLQESKQFVNLSAEVLQAAPYRSGQNLFVYLTKIDGSENLDVRTTTDLFTLADNISIGQITPDINTGAFEIRILNQRPYAIIYEQNDRIGSSEIWQLDGSVSKIYSLEKAENWKFGSKSLAFSFRQMVSNSSQNSYITNVIDFSNNVAGERISLELSDKIKSENILGEPVASRCDFKWNSTSMICAVKINNVDYTAFTERDILISFDFKTKDFKVGNKSLIFSAETVYISPQNDLYIVSQENKKLFKFSTKI